MTGLLYRSPESDEIVMTLSFSGHRLENWTSYTFNSHYETPTDGWHFEIGDDGIDDATRKALYPGARVELRINGLVQGNGYIDEVEPKASRSGGTVWSISGRDVFGKVVDSHVDPRVQFKPGDSLEDIVREVFGGFGFVDYLFDSTDDRKARLGLPTKKGAGPGSGTQRHKRKNTVRPNQHEGAFAFVSRLAQRQGLWIQPTADGYGVICDEPDYDQAPSHVIERREGFSNIEDGGPKYSTVDQPSAIVADGTSGGGEFGHSKIRCFCINPITGFKADGTAYPEMELLRSQYRDAKEIFFETSTFGLARYTWPRNYARTLYLHDESSRTMDELEAYVRREMSLRVRKFLSARYRIASHGLTDPATGAFVPWTVGTIVRVNDEATGLDTSMWVISVTFTKSRSGSYTDIELILPGALQFSAKDGG